MMTGYFPVHYEQEESDKLGNGSATQHDLLMGKERELVGE